jgi:hypothetical protein
MQVTTVPSVNHFIQNYFLCFFVLSVIVSIESMPAAPGTGTSSTPEFRLVLLVPKKHHPSVIGKAGTNTKRLSAEFKVRTAVPAADSESREIVVCTTRIRVLFTV